jgi:hypothetical protein
VAPGTVIVATRDGSMFRGVVVERIPGQYITVQLVTGEVRRIAWDQIASEAAASATAPAPVPAPAPRGPVVRVRFQPDSDRAQLERAVAEGKWESVCEGACQTNLDTASVYRVGGRGVRKSEPFRLPSDRPSLGIEADVGRTSSVVWGVIFIAGGAGSGLLGLVMLSATSWDQGYNNNDENELAALGLVFTLGGAAAIVGGILMVSNGRTDVNLAGRPKLPTSLALPGGFRLERGAIVF